MEQIPTNLDEAIQLVIDDIMSDVESRDYILSSSENDFLCNAHHSYGQHIRNTWRLWTKEPPLVKWFNEKGIYHADDMSGIILVSTYRKLNSKEIDLENQIIHYREYWNKVDPDVNLGKY